MSTATMTSKGQITIPKDIRLQLNLRSGDRVSFVVESDRVVRLVPATRDIGELRGALPRPRKSVSIDEMHAATRRHAAKRKRAHDRD